MKTKLLSLIIILLLSLSLIGCTQPGPDVPPNNPGEEPGQDNPSQIPDFLYRSILYTASPLVLCHSTLLCR